MQPHFRSLRAIALIVAVATGMFAAFPRQASAEFEYDAALYSYYGYYYSYYALVYENDRNTNFHEEAYSLSKVGYDYSLQGYYNNDNNGFYASYINMFRAKGYLYSTNRASGTYSYVAYYYCDLGSVYGVLAYLY